MPFALFEPNGNWYASVPDKDLRDEVLNSYLDKNECELTFKEISVAEYREQQNTPSKYA